jgi:hypothetical protein
MVQWEFETNDEGGLVTFSDGKCTITTGRMKWTEWSPSENIDINALDNKLKKFLLVNKL